MKVDSGKSEGETEGKSERIMCGRRDNEGSVMGCVEEGNGGVRVHAVGEDINKDRQI